MATVISGPAYVVQNNIDTDQIIPAQYLTLVPTIPEEYEKLGSYALIGLPDSLYPTRYVEEEHDQEQVPHRHRRTQLRLRFLARARPHRLGRGGLRSRRG